jgi:hypothetical protein
LLKAASANTPSRPAIALTPSTPPVRYVARTPPSSATGRLRNASAARRQLANAAWNRMKTPIAAAIANVSSRSRAASHCAKSPMTSAWYSSGNLSLATRCEMSVAHGRERAALHVRRDVDVALDGVVLDDTRGGDDVDIRDIAEPHLTAARLVDQRSRTLLRLVRVSGGAPHHDLEDLLLLVRLPTTMPFMSVAAALRTSPGLSP